jgi:hypothetical protein
MINPKLLQAMADWLAFARAERAGEKKRVQEAARDVRILERQFGIKLNETDKRWQRPASIVIEEYQKKIEEARRLLELDDALCSGNLPAATRKQVERYVQALRSKVERAKRFTTQGSKSGVIERLKRSGVRDRNQLIYALADQHAGDGIHLKRSIEKSLRKYHNVNLTQKQIGRILAKRPPR